jgi:hypothetical protein
MDTILAPLAALVLWSFVMWAWLYATRIPAMVKGRIVYDPQRRAEEFHAQLPASVRWKADNYNHLMEQPTLFYAICFSLQLMDQATDLNIGFAWLYVVIRVIHSLVQATVNVILIRFSIFIIASIVLGVLTFNAAVASGLAWFSVPSG